MSRFVQKQSSRGSQRWIQQLVNFHPDVLNKAIGVGNIEWVSPLSADDHAEYRDQAFLDRLGIKAPHRSLSSFWPSGGPQWDALGRAETGEPVLVECKAHINEIFSPPSRACDGSMQLIRKSLEDVKTTLKALPEADWVSQFYQYANRLAHAYFLQDLNGVPTKLVFLYITGDVDMRAPRTRAEWEGTISVLHGALGIRGRVPQYVRNAFVDVSNGIPAAS